MRRHWRERVLMSHALYLNQACVIAQSASPPPPEVSEENRAILSRLDHARSEYQVSICEVLSDAVNTVCAECGGRCCHVERKNTSFFYAIDFWLRYYTSSPIQNHGKNLMDHPAKVWPRQLFHLGFRLTGKAMGWIPDWSRATGKTRRSKQRAERSISNRFPSIPDALIPCIYLSDTGCALDPAERPSICVAHTCRALRQALTRREMERMIENVRRLKEIHGEVLRLLRREGRLGRFFGWSRHCR